MKRSARVYGEIPGQKALSVIAEMQKNCYDSTFTYPLVIKSGEGCVIRDVDGNSFLDFTSNIGACPLGYSHVDVVEAIKQVSELGVNKIAGQDFYCNEHANIAKNLLSITPSNFKAFFVNSGAEAVENAIKIAYRKRLADGMPVLPGVSCTGGFHGRTLGALTFTYSKQIQKAGFPELPVLRIKFCSDDNDDGIEEIEKILANNSVAFVLSEVIQGEGGYNFASPLFMDTMRKTTKKFGVPLILDEVQSGIGRTGKWWAFEHYDIVPDIISTAKALQVGAAVYKADYDPDQQGVLSSTWGGGDRIDLAIGSTVIEVIKRDHLLHNALVMGERLKKGLVDIAGKTKNGMITDVRGLGLMIGLEFDNKKNRDIVLKRAFQNGLLLLPAGLKTIRVIPPLIIKSEEVEEGLEILSCLLNQ